VSELLPRGWAGALLGDLRVGKAGRANVRSRLDQVFELWSVPSYATGRPEVLAGREIGSDKQNVVPGTVLVCRINPRINRIWVVGPRDAHEQIASTEWVPFFPIEGVVPAFLRYYMQQQQFREYLASNVSGVGGSLMRVRPEVVDRFPALLPPTNEQHRIVAAIEEHLSDLDAAVSALERVRATLPRYRTAVLKAACEGRLVETEAQVARAAGRHVETGEELVARFSTSAKRGALSTSAASLPPAPDGWSWSSLATLGTLDRGKSKHRPRDDARLYGGPYPFVQTGDVRHSGGVIRQHSQTYSEFGLSQSRMWPAGTLCITIAANIGDTGILSFPACFPDSVVGFTHEGDTDTVRFIELFLRTVKDRVERYAPATAQKNINLQILRAIAVPVPPLAEQRRILAEVDRRLSLADAAERAVEAGLTKAKRLRRAILRRAFEGKLVPQDPNDEPASVLLERIRAERTTPVTATSRVGMVNRRSRK
jgi:type I restriction enzyme S subunit